MTQKGLHKKVACKPTLVRNGAQQTPEKCVMVQGGKDLRMFEKLRMALGQSLRRKPAFNEVQGEGRTHTGRR